MHKDTRISQVRVALFVLIALGISTYPATGQNFEGAAAGQVTDSEGSPLYGATVWHIGTDQVVSANDGGHFVLPGVSGTIQLLVDAKHHAPKIVEVTVLPGQTAELKFSLTGLVDGANPIVAIVGARRQRDRVFFDSESGKDIRCGNTPTECVVEPGDRRFRVEDRRSGEPLCVWNVNVEQQDEPCFVCYESTGTAAECPTDDP